LNLKSHELRPGMLVKETDPEGQARVFVVTKLLDQDRYCGHDVFSWDDSLAEAWTQELGGSGQNARYEVSDNKLWYVEGDKRTLCMTLFEVNGAKYCIGTNSETKEVQTAEPYLPYDQLGNKLRRSMVFFDYNKSTWVLLPAE
jgi:hypothetical protein